MTDPSKQIKAWIDNTEMLSNGHMDVEFHKGQLAMAKKIKEFVDQKTVSSTDFETELESIHQMMLHSSLNKHHRGICFSSIEILDRIRQIVSGDQL
jgi:hypothetical protein